METLVNYSKTPRRYCASILGALALFVSQALGVQFPVSEDSWTSSSQSGTNNGTTQNLSILGADRRTWLKFDLNSFAFEQIRAQHVRRAILRIYVNSVTVAGQVDVVGVSGGWAEGTITHANAPSTYNDPGTNQPYASAQISTVDRFINIDITELVRDWLDGTSPNGGLVLKANSTLNANIDAKENNANSHSAVLDVDIGPTTNATGGIVYTDLSGNAARDIIITPGPIPSITIGGHTVLDDQSGNSSYLRLDTPSFQLGTGPIVYGAHAEGAGAVAMGAGFDAGYDTPVETAAIGVSAIALGYGSQSLADYSVAIGATNNTYASNSVALGTSNQLSIGANTSFAIGDTNFIDGPYSYALGAGNWIHSTASSSHAIGTGNSIGGYGDMALGQDNYVTGISSLGFGALNLVTADHAAAFSYGGIASHPWQFVIGTYNLDTDALFVIGSGSAAAQRRNALVVHWNNDTEAAGNVSSTKATGLNKFKAPILVPESGDISMGEFTAGEQP